jgi:acyl-CoA reductase-like NAD-dependent aldehyde dehydrogenase
MSETEDEEIDRALRAVQPQYPSLTLKEMRQILDETYDRLVREDDDLILEAEEVG